MSYTTEGMMVRRSTRVVVADNPSETGIIGANVIIHAVQNGSLRTLGVATGSSPLPIYAQLSHYREQLQDIRAFALDEYVGIPHDHPQSYHSVVHREVTLPLGLDPYLVRVPDGTADDLARSARDYEDAITAAGGIDLQIVGIGSNGHIGFNEPGSARESRTRCVDLTPKTRLDNARYFPSADDVPSRSLTQGIGTIMEARTVLLIATGEKKAAAVAAALDGPISTDCPASALRDHSNLIVVLDHEAATGLRRRHENRDPLLQVPIQR